MIFTLSDTYDLELLKRQWKEEIPEIVIRTIEERFEILKDAFGTPYLKNGSGFVSVIIITENTEHELEHILGYYHLDNEMYEYSEIVGEKRTKDQIDYRETLWLQGNDTSIIVFQALK